jgi:ATP-binding cassette subfamily F protein uup
MSADPSLLSATDLCLAYGRQTLLNNVTFAVAAGEKVGLVGRNGCGKTSLLKIISGTDDPDAGEVSRRRGLRVGYLPQEFELDGTKTVQENIESGAADLIGWLSRYESGDGSEAELGDLHDLIEHADGWNLDARIKASVSALDAPALDKLVGPLSGGEKRRVALCRALVAQPDLLLLDEPTNHLDAASIRWLEDYLRTFPGAVIFVTHDRYFLDVIATRILELADGRGFSHPGNYTAYLEAKAVRQQITDQTERRRQRFLREELDWVRAGVRAQRSKPRHRLKAFYQIKGLEAPPEEREMDLLLPPPPPLGDMAIDLIGAGAKVGEGNNERWLFRNLTLSLRPGQCTGVLGRNGAGKTTLLRACLGQRPLDEGKCAIAKKVVFNYIDQGRLQLNGTGTVMQEVSDEGEVVFFGEQRLSARAYLRRFLFPDERVVERVSSLSGGERARLALAKVLKRGGNCIVLDEPTNDLDLETLELLQELLADYPGTVLLVSHDRDFIDRVCTNVLVAEGEGRWQDYPGGWSDMLAQRGAPPWLPVGSTVRETPKPRATPATQSAAPARKMSFKDKHALEQLPAQMEKLQAGIAKLQGTLADPDLYRRDPAGFQKATEALTRATADLAAAEERWLELEMLRESLDA